MTRLVLVLALHWHLAILPVFVPKLSGIHDGQLTVSAAPAWRHILHSGELQEPDGMILEWRTKFE